jgi:hypothetical protein
VLYAHRDEDALCSGIQTSIRETFISPILGVDNAGRRSCRMVCLTDPFQKKPAWSYELRPLFVETFRRKFLATVIEDWGGDGDVT